MCGRFTQGRLDDEVWAFFGVVAPVPGLPPAYNVAPTEPAAVIVRDAEGRHVRTLRFGLTPPVLRRARDGQARPPPKLINARAETAADKGLFRAALARRRCVVPADGFYEWARVDVPGARGRTKPVRQPYRFTRLDGAPLGLAGIHDDAGFAILTTAANALVATLHDRMPVILPPDALEAWLDPGLTSPESWAPLFVPLSAALMRKDAVSRRVNDVANDGPELLAPDDDLAADEAAPRPQLDLFGRG
jgi:putative SOS response-associated peptidase YedK